MSKLFKKSFSVFRNCHIYDPFPPPPPPHTTPILMVLFVQIVINLLDVDMKKILSLHE